VIDLLIAQAPVSLGAEDLEAGACDGDLGFVAYVTVRDDASPREAPRG
jgi:hypothetical protein